MVFKEQNWWFYTISEVKVGPFETPEEAIEKALMSVKTSGLLSTDKQERLDYLESMQAELNLREGEKSGLEDLIDALSDEVNELRAKQNFER
jgi:hypothetical protein